MRNSRALKFIVNYLFFASLAIPIIIVLTLHPANLPWNLRRYDDSLCVGTWEELRSRAASAKDRDVITICNGASLKIPDGLTDPPHPFIDNPFEFLLCVGTWEELRISIASATEHDVITICQGAHLKVPNGEGPIKVKAISGLTIQCSACLITGGRTQFEIEGAPNMTFKGIAFNDVEDTHVKVKFQSDASTPREVKFQDCTFIGDISRDRNLCPKNAAIACEGDRFIESSDFGEISRLSIENSDFVHNMVHECVICNRGCALEVQSTLFKHNYAFFDGWSSSIIRNFNSLCDYDLVCGAKMKVADSCFIGNTGSLSPALYLDSMDTLGTYPDLHGNAGQHNFPCDGFYYHNWSFFDRSTEEHGLERSVLPACKELNTSECVRSVPLFDLGSFD